MHIAAASEAEASFHQSRDAVRAILVGFFNISSFTLARSLLGFASTIILTGQPVPTLVANPAQLNFYAGVGQESPAGIAVAVTAQPGPSSTYSVSTDQPWLSVTPVTNATNGITTVKVAVNVAGLVAGTYRGKVLFSAPSYAVASVGVILNIANASGALGPIVNVNMTASASSNAVGDFNGDGWLDLAISGSGGIFRSHAALWPVVPR